MLILSLIVFQTSGYTLTVVASDNGVPALSSSAMINIDISDVNDNPPLFSQANYSLIIQVREGDAGWGDQWRRLIIKEDKTQVDGSRESGGGAGENGCGHGGEGLTAGNNGGLCD